jgi:hypothetical protein
VVLAPFAWVRKLSHGHAAQSRLSCCSCVACVLGRVKGVSEKDMALVAGGNAERLLGLSKAKA